MSISETLANLAKIGPTCIKEPFIEFEIHLRNGAYFENELNLLKDQFNDPLADQLFETLIYANKFGGRNAIKILHELAEFVANDLSLRSEISTRFGWVKKFSFFGRSRSLAFIFDFANSRKCKDCLQPTIWPIPHDYWFCTHRNGIFLDAKNQLPFHGQSEFLLEFKILRNLYDSDNYL
jgi:hypothetical protein